MLFLASQSPRRRALLAQAGYTFAVINVAVPEERSPAETPRAYVERVARAKAAAGWACVAAHASQAIVLGADTEVVLDDRVFGKPHDVGAAAAMLKALAGRTHRVISVVCCTTAAGADVAVSESAVTFAALDAAAIARYVATGEPFGKAGGYAIQGRAATFVARLEGSYSGVVGLPLYATAALLRSAGLEV